MKKILTFLRLIFSISPVILYNISPVPNLIHNIRIPSETNKSDSKNSTTTYFGFSLLLRADRILIGAPKSNSTEKKLSNIVEPGELYTCSVRSSNDCKRFIVEKQGNIVTRVNEMDSEIREKQWLGATLSGETDENSNTEIPFMVCAPRVTTRDYHIAVGVCYINRNNQNNTSQKYKLRYSNSNVKMTKLMTMLGINSHWIPDRQTFLVGIPASDNGKGGFTKFNLNKNKSEECQKVFNKSTYGGYSLSAGIFDKNANITYVVSAPRQQYNGTVLLINENEFNDIEKQINGLQSFSYFGYSVLTEDINGDNSPEIIVSAPFYSEKLRYEAGAIYVYDYKIQHVKRKQIIVAPGINSGGRFGTTLASLGDINLDGYNDIAVSAPYEETGGNVFIYQGSINGLITKPMQILQSPNFAENYLNRNNDFFGFAISSRVDVDGNGINDIAISAVNSDKVYLYRSYPIVNVDIDFYNFPEYIHYTKPIIEITTCIKIDSLKIQFDRTLIFELDLNFDRNDKRLKFVNGSSENKEVIELKSNQTKCINHLVNIQHENNKKPFVFKLSYQHIQQSFEEKFCENCAIVHPNDRYKSVRKELFIKHTCGHNATCNSNLQVKIDSVESDALILDVDRFLTISFKIDNYKDPAYLPRINITTNQNFPLTQVSSTCSMKKSVIQCVLWNDNELVLKENVTKILNLTFDITNVKRSELRIDATVFSLSQELNETDNSDFVVFKVLGCGEIDIVDTSLPGSQFLNIYDDQMEPIEILKSFEVKNSGPSTLSNLIFEIQYPNILEFNSSDIISPIQPNIEIFLNNEIDQPTTITRYLNETDQDVIESNTNPTLINKNFFIRERHKKRALPTSISDLCISTNHYLDNFYSDVIRNISTEKKITFDSNEIESNKLRKSIFVLEKFKAGAGNTLTIQLKMKLNQTELWNLLQKYKRQYFIYKMNFVVKNQECNNDTNCTPSIVAFRTKVYEIFIKPVPNQRTGIWIYIGSFILGILAYFIIALLFYKLGFFKRKKHQEVKEFKRQSIMRQSMRITAIPDYDGVNSLNIINSLDSQPALSDETLNVINNLDNQNFLNNEIPYEAEDSM